MQARQEKLLINFALGTAWFKLGLNYPQDAVYNFRFSSGQILAQLNKCTYPKMLHSIMHRQFTIILFFSFAFTVCFAQTKHEIKKIAAFKKSYLKEAKLYEPDTLKLEHLIIVRQKYPEYREIKTFDKSKDFVVGEEFYNKTTQVKCISKYDTIGRPIGIAENYTKNGKLDYIQNYDKGEWIVYDKESHPYYDLQNKIKAKADSFISTMYGNSFLQNHTVWSIGGSYTSNGKEQRTRWTEMLKEEPTKFSFCFKVKLDTQNYYNSYIYFDLDNNGNFLPTFLGGGFFFSGSGFENVPDSLKGSFRLNYSKVLSEAKSLGLKETDSTKAYGRLFWEDFRKRNIYNGQFRFYIIIETSENVASHSNGRFLRTTKYDAYSFNPWSGEFVEIKKLKRTYAWGGERQRIQFSDIIPDKE